MTDKLFCPFSFLNFKALYRLFADFNAHCSYFRNLKRGFLRSDLWAIFGEGRMTIANCELNCEFLFFFVEILITTCNISWTTNWMLQINILCSFLIHAYFCQFQCSLSSALVVWVRIRNSQCLSIFVIS